MKEREGRKEVRVRSSKQGSRERNLEGRREKERRGKKMQRVKDRKESLV